MPTVLDFKSLPRLVGTDLGHSQWREVDQESINRFAVATGDDQWIHLDVERAAAGPFGSTIAHGFLTLSLFPILLRDVWRLEGAAMGVNYGLDRVRFLAPVPAGSKVRLSATLSEVTLRLDGSALVKLDATIEIEGNPRPALVASLLALYVPSKA